MIRYYRKNGIKNADISR